MTTTATEAAAVARSQLWALLGEALSFPTAALASRIRSGGFRASLSQVEAALPYRLTADTTSLHLPGLDDRELQAEFIRLFDAPAGGTPCPLYAGVYASNRRDAMEEILRFYRHFGLTSAGSRDLPDSLPTMCEFLQFLTYRESLSDGDERAQLRAAQRDFLARHLVRWAEQTESRLAGREPLPLYRDLIAIAGMVISAELIELAS
ncbi:MAG: hypothetical protein Kow0010_01670 [Dehalococcoidia bacterium]